MSASEQRRVEFDDMAVRILRGELVEKEIQWIQADEISVLTTDTGPAGEDFCLLLAGRGGRRCEVPSESEGFKALLDRVFQIPGFDHLKFGEACRSADSARFVCWRPRQRRWPPICCIGGAFGPATVWSAVCLAGTFAVLALVVTAIVELIRLLV